MLVLDRKIDESIIIDNRIEVMIVNVRGQIVRLGVTAPKSIPVHRKEIQERINAEVEVDA